MAAIVVPLIVVLLLIAFLWYKWKKSRAADQGSSSTAALTSAASESGTGTEDILVSKTTSSFSPKDAWARGIGKAQTVVAMAGPNSPWRVKTDGSNVVVDVDWKVERRAL